MAQQRTRDRIHLNRLVRLLDTTSHEQLDGVELLKAQTTARHARQLLSDLRHETGGGGADGGAASGGARRGELDALEDRLAQAERTLSALAGGEGSSRPTSPFPAAALSASSSAFSLSSLASTSTSASAVSSSTISLPLALAGAAHHAEEDDLSFLPLSAPTPPPFPFASTSSASLPSPPASPPLASSAHDAAPHARGTCPPPPAPSEDTSAKKTDDDDVELFGLRKRANPAVVPPYLAARRAREAAAKAAGGSEKGKEKAASSAAEDLLPADSGTSSSADLLSHHHTLQTSLLSSLTDLSGALKTSTLAFSSNLAKDKEVLERAQGKLEGNEGKMRSTQGRLEGVRGRSRGTTCWTIGAVVVVFIMWMLMFLLMREQIENVLRRYIVEYVTCKTCKSPDTELTKKDRLFFMTCSSCGSTRSVAAIKSGYQATTRAARRAAKAAT
ncbi:hypothetical protein JCM10213_008169 [Rhodosporidiobolus nylandii]